MSRWTDRLVQAVSTLAGVIIVIAASIVVVAAALWLIDAIRGACR